MAKIFIEEDSLTAIGNAIRAKINGAELLSVPNGMVSAIEGIMDYTDDFIWFVSKIGVKDTVYLPEGLVNIGDEAFVNHFCRHVVLPQSLRIIGAFAFAGNEYLEDITIPSNVESINGRAFSGCLELKTVTFEGTPSEIMWNIFDYSPDYGWCFNLTDIYVPWAEGEVPDAPWGAENATIHYNHTV